MKKRKPLFIFGGLGVIILALAIVYWFFPREPEPFLKSEQLVREINAAMPQAEASVVQDPVYVDEEHVLVPFISKDKYYGLSYWEWKNKKWNVESIDNYGEPRIWKINRVDPSTFYLVWNINPKYQLDYIKFYFIRDRGYHVSGELHQYDPGVQMEKKVSLEEKSFGAIQLPNEWVSFVDSFMKVEAAKQPDIFQGFFPEQYLQFGWIPYDREDNVKYPEGPQNGYGYSNGNEQIDYIMYLNEEELEIP